MNRDIFGGQWMQIKGIVRQEWGRLTNDPASISMGGSDREVGRLQESYGYARERVQKEFDDWLELREAAEREIGNRDIEATSPVPVPSSAPRGERCEGPDREIRLSSVIAGPMVPKGK